MDLSKMNKWQSREQYDCKSIGIVCNDVQPAANGSW
jgi:hypothetical protein